MTQQNLSEKLFKPKIKHSETSTLVTFKDAGVRTVKGSVLSGCTHPGWYRMINRLMWIWRGVPPLETEEVLSRIAASDAPRSDDSLLDTVIGYRRGNWAYEWSQQAMLWQRKALEFESGEKACDAWLCAANLYSIAGYPHLKGDELAEQATILANQAYENSARFAGYELKKIEFKMESGGNISAFLHLPPTKNSAFPTVMLCGSLDNLQSDYCRYFRDYLAPQGIALLTLDMPSVGYSSKQSLSQESSLMHQQVLEQLRNVPWIDHTRVAVVGLRFGANVAVRLAYLSAHQLRGAALLGPVVHDLFVNPERQEMVPRMYMDVLASRAAERCVDLDTIRSRLSCLSLKNQGLLGRRCTLPIMSVCWKDDVFSPKSESELIVRSSSDGKLLELGSTPVFDTFHKSLDETTRWLTKILC
ncbi:esterase FrsA [Morganella psychrotolerans]|uniref:Esterase FrsA n=1 Tax=Morganella psychrotolerans TaxID=368603 RepID=A0A1B8HAH6_9GAMM|nr:esterase FrsA [Morganella psychrotolerans]OBU06073.1 fermentation/respiration switch protein [Morganella psychrotolerans]